MNLKVYVYRRPNLFNVQESMLSLVGYGVLKELYTNEDYVAPENSKELLLYFPERFLNILEIRCLVKRLEKAGFEDVTISTGNEHLLTTVPSKCVGVVQDELIKEGSQFRLSNPEVGLPTSDGLLCIGGEITHESS